MRTRVGPAWLTGVAAAFAMAPPAYAETSPWYFGVTTGLSHDSNIFRRGDDNAVGDTVRSVGLQAGLDQPVGRQRVFANAQLSANRYTRFEQLDSTSYSLTSGVDWATVNHLSGTLRYSGTRGLADYGIADAPETTEKNLLSTRQAVATLRWEAHSALSLDTQLEHRSVGYTAEAYKPFASTQDVLGTGLRYRVGPHLGVGLGWRRTRGTTPEFEVAPGVFEVDHQRRNDFDLVATWSTDKVGLSARLSRSRESHSQASAPGFSGLTGAVDLNYQPTSKLRLSASVSRDTGSATTFLRFGNGGLDIDTRQVSNRLRASVAFSPTPKLSAALLARYDRGRVSNPFGDSNDRHQSYALQGAWEPRSWFRLACSVERELRDSTVMGRDSRSTVSACSASLSVR